MRVNLSVAIVYMVNNTAISGNGYRSRAGETDNDNKDGPFVWDEAQQGVILGMFFYGYVVTQVEILHIYTYFHTNNNLSGAWRKNGRDCGRKMAFWCW